MEEKSREKLEKITNEIASLKLYGVWGWTSRLSIRIYIDKLRVIYMYNVYNIDDRLYTYIYR